MNSAASATVAHGCTFPPRLPTHSMAAVAMSIRHCLRYLLRGVEELRKMKAMAMMRPRLAVTEPMALPTAMSFLPARLAITETIISGSVVARLTMVAPIMKGGMLAARAIQLAESTNQSPPLTTSTMPTANSRTDIQMLIKNTSVFAFAKTEAIKRTICLCR